MDSLQARLDELQVKPFYYYDGDITVCILAKDGQVESRGVAVRSIRDNFVKRVGRVKALGRAIQAIIRQETTGFIYYDRFSKQYNKELRKAARDFGFKSVYRPTKLTSLEKKLLGCIKGEN